MQQPSPPVTERAPVIVARDDFPELFAALHTLGFQIVGPTLREGAIVYDELATVDDLPIGYTDEQEAGTYRLKRRDDAALFGYNVGPQSWKQYLHLPRLRLWRAERRPGTVDITVDEALPPKLAFLGVRACELHAIAIQDQVFVKGPFVDRDYQQRRDRVCIIAVNCAQAGNTCFCVSMGTGPRVNGDFDLSLVELLDANRHDFLVEAGSELGVDLLERVPHRPAAKADLSAAETTMNATAASMGRTLQTEGIVELLTGQPEHPRWSEVATRCLSCTNCTMVCPTCFCTSVQDTTDLLGQVAERWQHWDSCFTMDFSHIAGGSIRASTKSRYRQWMTHKLATWFDQFGTSGCVGCGRCITWCPVGIDITVEVRAIRQSAEEDSSTATGTEKGQKRQKGQKGQKRQKGHI
ncbi:MAG: 4Fe-4S dicluster domain-containing protein [Ktedonobacterales bacterium]